MATKSRWDFDRFKFGICDVESNYNFYFKWLLGKLNSLFIWENLPETVDEQFLNQELFLNGYIGFTEINNKLYALNGAVGGKVNEYYRPTEFIIANPVLGSKTGKIGDDTVVMYNSDVDKELYLGGGGLYQLIKQTATLLADNIVSINCAQINGRVSAIYTADTVALKNTAQGILKRLYSGEPYQVIDQDIINKLQVQPLAGTTNGNDIQKLTELHQYLIAQFYQNIGIKCNSVMKKERLITDEINSQEDYLCISLDVMEKSRKEAVKQINEMFGTDIRVKINPILAAEDKTEDKENNGANGNFSENGEVSEENKSDNLAINDSENDKEKEEKEEKETAAEKKEVNK